MNYVVFDLEFNQKHPDNKSENTSETPTLLFEIIQIGALKLNRNYKTLSTFNNFVNPTIHTTIHPYVENLTNITFDKLSSSKFFSEVYNDFIKFIGDEEVVLVVWGTSDIKELIRNASFYGFPTDILPKKYIDIQEYTSKLFKCPKGTKIGLKNAIEKLNLPTTGDFHDAFNDAYYTALIFSSIHNNEIKPKTYIPLNKRQKKSNKEKVNTSALIDQFEKMYNRNLTNEEKEIIKLAYNMGRTNQFTKLR